MQKTIGIKFIGSTRASENVGIQPGQTAAEVLEFLNLKPASYRLGKGDENNARVFASGDNIYPHVEDGDMLHASARVDAGVDHVHLSLEHGFGLAPSGWGRSWVYVSDTN